MRASNIEIRHKTRVTRPSGVKSRLGECQLPAVDSNNNHQVCNVYISTKYHAYFPVQIAHVRGSSVVSVAADDVLRHPMVSKLERRHRPYQPIRVEASDDLGTCLVDFLMQRTANRGPGDAVGQGQGQEAGLG